MGYKNLEKDDVLIGVERIAKELPWKSSTVYQTKIHRLKKLGVIFGPVNVGGRRAYWTKKSILNAFFVQNPDWR